MPVPWVKLRIYEVGLLPGVIIPELEARRRFLRGADEAGSAGLSTGVWVTAGSEFSKVSTSESSSDSGSNSLATGTGVALILIGSM